MRPCGACACAAIALSLVGPARAADPPPRPADDAESKAPRPPRPPLPPEPPRTRLPWQEHIEVGGGLALSALLASRATTGGEANQIRFKPSPGFHVRLSWEALPYVWFTGYLVEAAHAMELPRGALGLPVALTGDDAHVYTFGARVSPTLPLGPRARIWLTAGAGWGRIAYPRLCPQQPCGAILTVRERAASVVEVPIGLGAAFDLIPRWLRLHLELTGSLLPSQIGDALETGQVIDAAGRKRDVGPMPHLEGSIVQTIGLSLVL